MAMYRGVPYGRRSQAFMALNYWLPLLLTAPLRGYPPFNRHSIPYYAALRAICALASFSSLRRLISLVSPLVSIGPFQ